MSDRNLTLVLAALAAAVMLLLATNLYLLREVARLNRTVAPGEVAALQTRLEEAESAATRAERQATETQRQLDVSTQNLGLLVGFVSEQLGTLETQVLTFTVPIDEQLPIAATIPLDEEFVVPIEVTVPIDTSVNVPLNLGILGTFNLDIPIRTQVPVSTSVTVPLSKQVPIETTVPIRLDVPVALSLAETSLGAQVAEWRTLLEELRGQFPAEP